MKQLLHHSSGQARQTGSDPQRDTSSRSPLGTINVIFAAPSRTGSYPSRVMSVAWLSTEDSNSEPKRAKIEAPLVLSFSADDKIGTIQPHNDALMVTVKIGGYDAKIKNESFFKWPNKMVGNPMRCNQRLYCQYH